HGVGTGLRIARAVGEKHAVGIQGEHVGSGRFRRDNGDAAALAHQFAQDVVLDPVIVGHDVMLRRLVFHANDFVGIVGAFAGFPLVSLLGGDDAGQIGAVHFGNGAGLLDELPLVG